MPNSGKARCPENSYGERSGESGEEDSDQHGDSYEVRESGPMVSFGSVSLPAAAGDSGNGEVGEAPTASGVGPGPAPVRDPVLAPVLPPDSFELVSHAFRPLLKSLYYPSTVRVICTQMSRVLRVRG